MPGSQPIKRIHPYLKKLNVVEHDNVNVKSK